MIPAAFEYRAPVSEEELFPLLAKYRDAARLLAGGQSLIPALKARLLRPAVVIDLRRIPELHEIEPLEGGGIRIGAMVTQREIELSPLVAARCPLLRSAASMVGDAAVRNVGTLLGSLSQADPAADQPAVLAALDAEVEVAGPRGERIVKAVDFIQGPFETALESDEYARAVRIWPAAGVSAYAREPLTPLGFALAGAACRIALEGGKVREARLAVVGMGPRVFRAYRAEQALVGLDARALSGDLARFLGEIAEWQEAISDSRASAEYRRHLAAGMARRALLKALSGEMGGS